jgi:hypothetical protein
VEWTESVKQGAVLTYKRNTDSGETWEEKRCKKERNQINEKMMVKEVEVVPVLN